MGKLQTGSTVHNHGLSRMVKVRGCPRKIAPDLIEQIVKGYHEIGKELMNIGQIKIPRLLSLGKLIKNTHLLVFGDGSGIAYGACAYLRTSYEDGTVTVRLVKAAKKCTPVRKQTIPRIELMASLEAAKLSSRLKKIVQPNHMLHCCTILESKKMCSQNIDFLRRFCDPIIFCTIFPQFYA